MKKKFFTMILTVCLCASVIIPAEIRSQASDETTTITVFHTNDTHGYLAGDNNSVIGIDQVAGLKDSVPDAILADAGDATQGLPLASLTKGADVIELMNLAGYDVMTAGNHEFDFGTEQFLNNVRLADFPVLTANIYRYGKPLLSGIQEDCSGCHTIIERKGIKVGFFGLTTTETATSTNPAGISDLTFRDEIETAKEEIDHLEQEGADVIIAVTHLGDGYVPCTSTDLANALTGEYQDCLDVIIDGHSHTVENETVNDVLVVQTGSNMNSIGELTLEVTGDDVKVSQRMISVAEMNNVTPKTEVTDKLDEIQESQAGLLGEEVGETPVTLWAGWIGDIAMTRLEETNFGDLAADAFREAAEDFTDRTGTAADKRLPVVAVENGGGIREAVGNGSITTGDLMTAFPFSNTLYLKKITPAILYDVMEVSGSALDGQDKETGMLLQKNVSGGFLQISGFKVVYDPDGEEGDKVSSITLDGEKEPLDKNDNNTQIIMVGNNYIMSGGNDYTMLESLPKYGEAGGELEVIRAYVEACLAENSLGQYAGTRDRILMRGNGYIPGTYNACIKITDEEGNPAADMPLSYRVDGGKRINGVTDENGILIVSLSEGGHGIRLADSQDEVYVSNYSGIGLVKDGIRSWPELIFLSDGSCAPVADEQEGQESQLPDTEDQDIETEKPVTDTDVTSDTEEAQKNAAVSADMEAPQTSDGGTVLPVIGMIGAGMCAAIAADRLRRRADR